MAQFGSIAAQRGNQLVEGVVEHLSRTLEEDLVELVKACKASQSLDKFVLDEVLEILNEAFRAEKRHDVIEDIVAVCLNHFLLLHLRFLRSDSLGKENWVNVDLKIGVKLVLSDPS